MFNRMKMSLSYPALDMIPDHFFESDTATFLDPDMAGAQVMEGVVQKLREFGHSDENIKTRVCGIVELETDLNYVMNTFGDRLVGRFITGNFLTMDIGKKADVIISSPTFEHDGIDNSSKNWMHFFQKTCDTLNPHGHSVLFLPQSWSSPSTEYGVREKILTTLTTKFNLIEAIFGKPLPTGVSLMHFSRERYSQATKINGVPVDLRDAFCIPFWMPDLPKHLKVLRELNRVPEESRYMFSRRGSIPMKLLSEKPTRGAIMFPNASGNNAPRYGKRSSKKISKKMFDTSQIGVPKLMCSYINSNNIVLTPDPYGKMGCMHNMRMVELEYGEDPKYNKNLFKYLGKLSAWNVNYVEMRIMSLLIRDTNLSKYLTEESISVIEQ